MPRAADDGARARACVTRAPDPRPVAQTGHGPFGCNLFVFHIPNDMTNMDLYSLFIPFGNVISVRIMIEKETGRSRGFGFVSFDNRPAAEFAIKSMNGFQIGHKRLKVQHKNEKLDKPDYRSGRPNWGGPSPGGRDDDEWQQGEPHMPPLAQTPGANGPFAPSHAHAMPGHANGEQQLPQMPRPGALEPNMHDLAHAFEAHLSMRAHPATTAMPAAATAQPRVAHPVGMMSMAAGTAPVAAMPTPGLVPGDGHHLPRFDRTRPALSHFGANPNPALNKATAAGGENGRFAPVHEHAAAGAASTPPPVMVMDAQVCATGESSWEGLSKPSTAATAPAPAVSPSPGVLNYRSNQHDEPDYDALLSSVLSDLAGGGSTNESSASPAAVPAHTFPASTSGF